MKIIKKINNNFALGVDSAGNTVILSGRGIGFGEIPRELESLDAVTRTYYDIDESMAAMINDIPEDIIEISAAIVDYARKKIDCPLNSSIVFFLADHINFAIDRYRKKMDIKLPLIYDIENLFETEMDIGRYGLKLIKSKLKFYLPKEEAAYIALHLINAEEKMKKASATDDDEIVDTVTQIVEDQFDIRIDRSNFHYARFVTHLLYLLKRGKQNELIDSINGQLFEEVREMSEQAYQCSELVSNYLNDSLNIELSNEEKLYLMLHINRLCIQEDCNQ